MISSRMEVGKTDIIVNSVTDYILLHTVGGRYIFIYRRLLEYFAAIGEENYSNRKLLNYYGKIPHSLNRSSI